MGKERFESAYQGTAPWDIPGPQPAFKALEEAREIHGSVLDAGCGTGENALFLASHGHEVWGLDFVPVAVERATAKAKERGLSVHFQVGDALKLDQLGRTFDTAIDCGLFHTSPTSRGRCTSRGSRRSSVPEVVSTFSASAMRSLPDRGRGGSRSRKSGMPSGTAGRSSISGRLGSRRPITRKH
jgi:SAM-dependent methyltransferase